MQPFPNTQVSVLIVIARLHLDYPFHNSKSAAESLLHGNCELLILYEVCHTHINVANSVVVFSPQPPFGLLSVSRPLRQLPTHHFGLVLAALASIFAPTVETFRKPSSCNIYQTLKALPYSPLHICLAACSESLLAKGGGVSCSRLTTSRHSHQSADLQVRDLYLGHWQMHGAALLMLADERWSPYPHQCPSET